MAKIQEIINYLFYPSKNKEQKNGWIILLPGSSGLKIFDDQHFYHRKAERLSNNNFDVILIDYKQYFKNSRDVSKPQKSTGEKLLGQLRKYYPKWIHLN